MTASLPVVHLELHTADMTRARALCERLCGWRAERMETASGSYLALELGKRARRRDRRVRHHPGAVAAVR